MAIVLPCPLTVHEYAAAARNLELSRPDCPKCDGQMSFWGWYTRQVRVEVDLRLTIRRVRCSACSVSHGLVPEFVAIGRLDSVEVIGEALTEMATGASIAATAEKSGVPFSTVRGWLRRLRRRAATLTKGFLRALVALGDLPPRLSSCELQTVLIAASAAAAALSRRSGGGSTWRLANRIVGGHLLTTNIDPPWISA